MLHGTDGRATDGISWWSPWLRSSASGASHVSRRSRYAELKVQLIARLRLQPLVAGWHEAVPLRVEGSQSRLDYNFTIMK